MALITTYATLQAAIADELNRTDLTDAIKVFIQTAETKLKRDPRVRQVDASPVVFAALSDAATTNWLLLGHPDIYLYAALVESAPYLKDDDRLGVWAAMLEERVATLGSTRLDPTRALGLTTHAHIVRQVKDYLDNPNLDANVPTFILLAEAALRRDKRLRKLKYAAFDITADALAVPTDLKVLETWAHDGTQDFGAIEIVPHDLLSSLKVRYGTTGVPRFAAIVAGVFYFAPVPSTTFATKMTYWRKITALASGTNWLIEEHPDIYIYAALKEAAVFLKDAAAAVGYGEALEARIEELHSQVQNEMYTGSLRRQFEPIGG